MLQWFTEVMTFMSGIRHLYNYCCKRERVCVHIFSGIMLQLYVDTDVSLDRISLIVGIKQTSMKYNHFKRREL